ncbi:hypothetical protein [Rhizobium herbae]|jgi:hypothetical protein
MDERGAVGPNDAEKRSAYFLGGGQIEKTAPAPLPYQTGNFVIGCSMLAARQFREKSKICNFDEILAC